MHCRRTVDVAKRRCPMLVPQTDELVAKCRSRCVFRWIRVEAVCHTAHLLCPHCTRSALGRVLREYPYKVASLCAEILRTYVAWHNNQVNGNSSHNVSYVR